MDVCYLINQLAPGGAPTLLSNLVEGMGDRDVTFTVCMIGGDDTLVADFESKGVEVVNFDAKFKFDPIAVLDLARFLRERDFDVLHAHLPYAQTLGRICSLFTDVDAVVSTQHNVPGNYHPVTRFTERVTRRLDDATIAVSRGVERAFRGDAHMFDGSLEDGWCTIHNGIDVEGFHDAVRSADAATVEPRVSAEDLVYLNVSRYVPGKAQDVLIDAMEDVVATEPGAKLFVVGWGKREAKLRQRVRDRGLEESVTITGRVPSVHEYYALADVFVSSSIHEGLPTTHLEAMAATVPIVGTEIPGVTEAVVDGETGTLVPPRDRSALSDAMLELVDEDERMRLAENGYDHVHEQFDTVSTVDRHHRLYESLVVA